MNHKSLKVTTGSNAGNSLVNNPENSSITHDDDDARNHESDNEESGFAAAAVRIGKNGTSFQLRVISELAWNLRI